MLKDGDPLSTIFIRVRKVNGPGWGRGKVREVLFGRAY